MRFLEKPPAIAKDRLTSLGTSSVWSGLRFTTSRGGENSTGTMGIFAPALTKSADGRVATEAAWLNGDNLEKEEINE